mmetsp:Transcript_14357/g.16695  ORF Transcript_14357/g.16695 Transcript_14357/m.16695 type:complete len:1184 (-) Transcript_14357:410-3961(-)
MALKGNPFEKFTAKKATSAGSTGGGGSWMTTKKRGRDDEQIERDRLDVIDKRKRSRSNQNRRKSQATTTSTKKGAASKSVGKGKTTRNNKRAKTRNTIAIESSDEDSFIANDSEDIESEVSEEDFDIEESDEEEEFDEASFNEDDYDDDDDDDDDDDEISVGESDLESVEHVDSSPEKKMKNSRRQQGKVKVALKIQRGRAKRQTPKQAMQDPIIVNSDSNSSDEELEIIRTTQTKTTKKKHDKHKSKEVVLMDDMNIGASSSSEDENELLSKVSFAKTKSKTKSKDTKKTESRFFFSKDSSKDSSLKNNKLDETEKDSELDVASPSPLIQRRNSKKKKRALQFSDDDDNDDDADDDSDNDNHDVASYSKVSNQKQISNNQGKTGLSDTDSERDFDQDDQDEAVAVSLAMGASRKEALSKSSSNLQKKTKKVMLYKDDLEDSADDEDNQDEDEDDGEEVDAYESPDEDEREASNVLDAANKLSQHILSVLQKWCVGDDDGKNDASKQDDKYAPKSLILNGALSLTSSHLDKEENSESNFIEEKKVEENVNETSKTNDIKWISNDEMRKVCPDIILKNYQLLGVNWMALLHHLTFDIKSTKSTKKAKAKSGDGGRNVNGVLADEMGLGKTVQTIAFLAWLKYRKACKSNRPHIIVVPASVLSNWQNEFEKFCPDMLVVRYHGSMSERLEIKDKLRQYFPKKKGPQKGSSEKQLDVVLTTFSYFSSEKADDRNFLRKFDWNYMVVDEAHCLKNPKGARYRNMDKFNTQRRLLLTGTPVQNSPKELMSLLCFLMPLFTNEASGFDENDSNDGGARMLEHFVRMELLKDTGKTGTKKTVTHEKAVTQEQAYAKLKQLLAPFILRRCKSDVIRQWLPPKVRKIEWVPLDEKIRNVYESILSNHLKSRESESAKSYSNVFTDLRKAANHPLLLRIRHTSPAAIEHLSKHLFMYGYFGQHETCNQGLVKKELQNFSDYDVHCAALTLIEENKLRTTELDRYLLEEEDLLSSPKFVRLKELLPELVVKGHRMLIFSQWTRCLDLLGCLMDTLQLSFLRLDGQTNIRERQDLIDEFNRNEQIPVFLLSTRAGGMGINLTAADTCILHDLDFNPFNDLQAEDRCHRIGQRKEVTVVKMIAENTVDSDIYNMQERKSEMNDAIFDSTAKNKVKETTEMNNILEMALSRYQHENK